MKLSHIVTVSALIAGASARGIRGASERAFYFSTYVSEEIFTDASKRTVATGCVGTRTGLRNQPNRCTFMEFCDHLWHETEINANTHEMDKRPDITKTYMGNVIDKNKNSLLNYGAVAMRQGILNLRMNLPDGSTANVPKWGYTGDLNVANLVDGGTAANYFDKVGQEFAERYWKAKLEFDEVAEKTGADKLDDDLKQLFKTWNNHAVESSKMSYAYREKELRTKEPGTIKSALQAKYEDPDTKKLIKVETRMLDKSEVVWGEPYKVYDKEATATKLASIPELGLTKDQALTLLTDVYNTLQGTPIVEEHQRALAGAKKAMNVASTGCVT
ncbi:hypothetical protein N7491_006819 [Penicillium cf. griseofulvum]|uniref:Uncharacterized protein n=1 Tax=Penicillium cf. griseofulvum TaxID=2972120 RepID=A0A9W9IYV3_9EURO|nr:hypothetical protein N7472_010150 [Penicillium cf. griseofulvum]KAJ5429803.1 hypothetical protein N7491_006819 [Penicillium cf. griseofulvum]KAJ5436427.1 hypothetical protein N7445_007312 [Penicillium cf. griseofulvum]